ncbi:MAG: DUF429 domain-containing protein [Caldimonas sp.]
MRLAGIDFTCAPSRRKPITVATGQLEGAVLRLGGIAELTTLAGFEAWLGEAGPWLGAFDFPFGLPREFVEAAGLGTSCADVIGTVRSRCPTRMAWRAFIDAWGNTRPAGTRLLHRRTDLASPAASTSPMQSRYVPVAFMYYEGVARLVASGVSMPGLHDGDPRRVALEGYPRRLAHAFVGRRSYKNGDDDDRRASREEIVAMLEGKAGGFGFALACDAPTRASLLADASGDRLDAVLCLVQAAVASTKPRYGLPDTVDAVEGWIATD